MIFRITGDKVLRKRSILNALSNESVKKVDQKLASDVNALLVLFLLVAFNLLVG